MTHDQIIIREFLEKVLLEQENLSELNFENLNLEEFCQIFELGDGFYQILIEKDFPFAKWRDEFFAEYLAECEENDREAILEQQDYYNSLGV